MSHKKILFCSTMRELSPYLGSKFRETGFEPCSPPLRRAEKPAFTDGSFSHATWMVSPQSLVFFCYGAAGCGKEPGQVLLVHLFILHHWVGR